MILIGNQVLPGQRGKEPLPDSDLCHSGGVDMALPSILERPGIGVAVELPGASGEHGPVFLLAQHQGRSEVLRVTDIFQIVMRLHQVSRRHRLLVVTVQHLDVSRRVSVGAIQIDEGDPTRVVE